MVRCWAVETEPEKCRRIVLLGNVGSGKTTFCKQIVDSYLGGFSKSIKKEFRKHIQANILHRMVVLRRDSEIAAEIKEDETVRNAFALLDNAAMADFDYTDDNLSYVKEVLDAAILVGNLPVMQKVVQEVFYTAPWDYTYFTSIERIFRSNYRHLNARGFHYHAIYYWVLGNTGIQMRT